jgi:hypothetical protein
MEANRIACYELGAQGRLLASRHALASIAAAVAAVISIGSVAARAHDPGMSRLDVRIEPTGITATLDVSARDIATIAGGHRSFGEIAHTALQVTLGGRPLTPDSVSVENDDEDGVLVRLRFTHSIDERVEIRSVWLQLFPHGHRQFVMLRGATSRTSVLSKAGDTIEVDPRV